MCGVCSVSLLFQDKKREGVHQSMEAIKREREACEEARLQAKAKVSSHHMTSHRITRPSQIQQLEAETQAVRGQMTQIVQQHESEMATTRKELDRLYVQVGKYNAQLCQAMDSV